MLRAVSADPALSAAVIDRVSLPIQERLMERYIATDGDFGAMPGWAEAFIIGPVLGVSPMEVPALPSWWTSHAAAWNRALNKARSQRRSTTTERFDTTNGGRGNPARR